MRRAGLVSSNTGMKFFVAFHMENRLGKRDKDEIKLQNKT